MRSILSYIAPQHSLTRLNAKWQSNNNIYKAWLLRILLSCFIVTYFFQTAYASTDAEKTGDVLQIIIPSVAYGSTFYLDDEMGRNQFYKSFATTVLITQGLKNIIHKKRPNGSDKSFPSGHTSAAFQGASFIHERYGLKYAIYAYIGASYVGYSRVESDNHYLEDVLAGAAIGILSNLYFTTPYKGFVITPSAGNNTYGLKITKDF